MLKKIYVCVSPVQASGNTCYYGINVDVYICMLYTIVSLGIVRWQVQRRSNNHRKSFVCCIASRFLTDTRQNKMFLKINYVYPSISIVVFIYHVCCFVGARQMEKKDRHLKRFFERAPSETRSLLFFVRSLFPSLVSECTIFPGKGGEWTRDIPNPVDFAFSVNQDLCSTFTR